VKWLGFIAEIILSLLGFGRGGKDPARDDAYARGAAEQELKNAKQGEKDVAKLASVKPSSADDAVNSFRRGEY
jgi:hypothetical protein